MKSLQNILVGAVLGSLYGCVSEPTLSYQAVTCKSDQDCKGERICNVVRGVCEDPVQTSSYDINQSRNYDAGGQRQYDASYSMDMAVTDSYSGQDISIGSTDKGYDLAQKVIKGDVNCDGKIDNDDITILNDYVNKKITEFKDSSGKSCGSTPESVGDVNCDGKIDNDDITLLFNFYAFDKSFPSC